MEFGCKVVMFASLASTAVGCHKNEADRPAETANTPVSNTSVSNGPSRPAASAQEAIADARCAREQTCGNVGDNKKYSSHEDCLSRIRADWKDDLNSRECPNGANQTQLDECLKAIKGEDCGNPFDTLSRIAQCTKSQICNS